MALYRVVLFLFTNWTLKGALFSIYFFPFCCCGTVGMECGNMDGVCGVEIPNESLLFRCLLTLLPSCCCTFLCVFFSYLPTYQPFISSCALFIPPDFMGIVSFFFHFWFWFWFWFWSWFLPFCSPDLHPTSYHL